MDQSLVSYVKYPARTEETNIPQTMLTTAQNVASRSTGYTMDNGMDDKTDSYLEVTSSGTDQFVFWIAVIGLGICIIYVLVWLYKSADRIQRAFKVLFGIDNRGVDPVLVDRLDGAQVLIEPDEIVVPIERQPQNLQLKPSPNQQQQQQQQSGRSSEGVILHSMK